MSSKLTPKTIISVVLFIAVSIIIVTIKILSQSTEIAPINTLASQDTTPLSISPQVTETTISKTNATPTWQPLPAILESDYTLITNGNRSTKLIALTFDACQRATETTDYDTEIVRILNETNTPATFFLGGLWMRDHTEATLELASNPLFELGNHSWSHLDFEKLTPEEITEEIQKTQKQMYDLLGYQTNLFRFPFGTYTESALVTIKNNGLYSIQWDVVSGDPDPNIYAPAMIDWVLYQVQPGSIIIMHVNGRGWHTAEALPAIIETLRSQGYKFVTVSDLLELEN